jgi:hypothetical protein
MLALIPQPKSHQIPLLIACAKRTQHIQTRGPTMAATAAIAKALDLKEKGNQAFKNGEYRAAMTAYHEIFMYVHGYSEGNAGAATLPGQTTRPVTKEEMDQIHELKLAHFCNLAMCHMKVVLTPEVPPVMHAAATLSPTNAPSV